MSMPLRRDRPLWEIWICEDVPDQQIGLVGKVHHCMVDGHRGRRAWLATARPDP